MAEFLVIKLSPIASPKETPPDTIIFVYSFQLDSPGFSSKIGFIISCCFLLRISITSNDFLFNGSATILLKLSSILLRNEISMPNNLSGLDNCSVLSGEMLGKYFLNSSFGFRGSVIILKAVANAFGISNAALCIVLETTS